MKRKYIGLHKESNLRPIWKIPFTPYFICRWKYWKTIPNIFVIAKKRFKNGVYEFKEI